MQEATAARYCDMTLPNFRTSVRAGLLPAGRTPATLAAAGLLLPVQAAVLPTMPLWHRAEIDAHSARIWGLDGSAALGQAEAIRTAREALDAFDPRRKRAAASHDRPARR
jgi:hypothetical protein